MTETIKTIICVAIAAGFAIASYVLRPATGEVSLEDEVNQPLFPEFTDPLQVDSLSIVKYDSQRDRPIKLNVANSQDGWQIESKEGYPATAKEKMSEAANSLVGLTVLGVMTDLPSEHEDYGVVEPNSTAINAEEGSVGQLVQVEDPSGKTLASLIVGFADKEKPNLRYVRELGRDRVYQVQLDPTVFSTQFSDWIDPNLFKINPFDVARMRFRNYSLQIATGQIELLQNMDASVTFDAEKSSWGVEAVQLPQTTGREMTVFTSLPEGTSLNSDRLNDIRSALNGISIVDVYRKPENLAKLLRDDDDLKNLQAADLPTLLQNGFVPTLLPGDDTISIAGMNGGLEIETIDDIRYRISYGSQKLGGDDNDQNLRYIFVQAEPMRDAIPLPELQPVPEIQEGEGEDVEAQAKKREEIMQANDRIQAEYRRKINALERKIYDLNARFADWYYVISEEDFQKLQVSVDQLIQKPNDSVPQPGGGLGIPGLEGLNIPGMGSRPPVQPEVRPGESAVDSNPEMKTSDAEPTTPDEPSDETMPEKPATEEPPATEEKPKNADNEGSGSGDDPPSEDRAEESQPVASEEKTEQDSKEETDTEEEESDDKSSRD